MKVKKLPRGPTPQLKTPPLFPEKDPPVPTTAERQQIVNLVTCPQDCLSSQVNAFYKGIHASHDKEAFSDFVGAASIAHRILQRTFTAYLLDPLGAGESNLNDARMDFTLKFNRLLRFINPSGQQAGFAPINLCFERKSNAHG